MIIHAPKIFQQLLENDALENIFLSFELHDNSKKMFDLAEGQGGRSGEFFFFSYDNKYVLKTITQEEFAFIDSNLYFFHEHYSRNPLSLLAKIYGLFTFSGNEMQRTYHLILMKNILGCPRDQIIRTYDLKGSKYDR
jgi:1-phosphatidylinositol-4-phosphate 5-kinase